MSEDHGQGSFGREEEGRLKLDRETRNQWLDKDAGLQAQWRKSGMTRDDFISHHQREIDEVITANSKG